MLDSPAVPSCLECPLGAFGGCAFTSRRVARGTQLWSQGEVPPEVIFVKSGVLGLSTSDASGAEVATAVRGPRSLLGFEALRGQSASSSMEALTDSVVCMASPLTVWQNAGLRSSGAAGSPHSAASTNALFQLTLDELLRLGRDSERRSGSAMARVARFLGEHGDLITTRRHAPFSKRHVASLLGLRPETFSRCLRVLEAAGVISRGPDLRVLDSSRLQDFG